MSANLFSLFIIILIANAVLTAVLPRLQDEHVRLEPTDDNKYSYTLRIEHPDGAVREETVQEIDTGEPLVNGVFRQDFEADDNDLKRVLVITYEAGPNGYVAKVRLVLEKREPVILGLSPNALKSAAG
ncbi:uncharacterized protein LOC133845220 [Drosophila sulfurigaster albostrigata]|uniref:Uncharacterized protein LOC117568882 n=1 Tax=Drosophila albomicans TaxID=7291 RepID=A0A6P8X1S6_DROAB|nr:uncharacterized protein LOC117568882 [Drosophila albomicans]XP_060656786.1 uncharacterized protein LOC132791751 [Drosophila nasuta]XP_062135597.1 uncharacterized protein LOC133845220 [Drosophila sulfurigaster albostrigata]